MSVLLTEPTVVVGVGDAAHTDAVRDALLEGTATDVLAVETASDALEVIDDRKDIGCVLTDQRLPETTGVDLCRDVRERAELLPVVFYVDTAGGDGEAGDENDGSADTETPRAALNAGADGYYTTADPVDDVRRAVDEAIESYDRRQEAAEESDIFDTLLEDSGLNVYVKDEDARYLRAAPVPDAPDPADVLGNTDVDVYTSSPEMAQQTYEDDLSVIETGEPIRDKDEWYGEGRTAYAVRTTKVPWTGDDGTPRGLIGVTTDITEFKRQELDLEILRDQFEKFSSNVRHDLKNPLQVAIGHIQLGRETGDEDAFDTAMEALERIEEIIADLESLAKDESSAPGQGTNDLADIVDAVWNVLYTREATLENRVPNTARMYIAEQTIRPILENLFKNAVTHGGEDVTVRVGTLADGFYIEDTGPGIPESERDRVLQPGYTTGDSGNGMGLSIVADVASQQGWTVDIGESPEGGARFEITNCPLILEPTADDRTDVAAANGPLDLDAETAVGTLESGGSAAYDPATNRWTVTADGSNIWRHWNDFYFVHTAVDGPVRIQGRVADVEDVDSFSKAGLMIRDDCDEDATYGFIGSTPGFGTEVLWRTERGEDGISQQIREKTHSEWFRVDLLGDRVTCFVSQNGTDWTPIDQRAIECTSPMEVGMVVCSVVSGQPCEAVFENVSVFELEETDAE